MDLKGVGDWCLIRQMLYWCRIVPCCIDKERCSPVYKVARLLLVVSVPIILIATPLYVLITPGYVHRAYERPGFPPSTRFGPEERRRLSDVLVDYLRGRATLQEMQELRTDAGEIAMRPSEVQHMVDVKEVTDAFFIAHVFASVLAVGSSIVLLGRRPLAWAQGIRFGVWATLGLIAVVAVAAAADFDLFFTLFHRIFFEEGTWLFFFEDTLIQLYPLPFWVRAVADISIVIVAGGAVLYLLAWWVERRTQRTEP